MKTYTNYYDVQDGKQAEILPEVLETIREIIVRSMSAAFGIEDLTTVDLQKGAEDYLPGLGLTGDEADQLKAELGGSCEETSLSEMLSAIESFLHDNGAAEEDIDTLNGAVQGFPDTIGVSQEDNAGMISK